MPASTRYPRPHRPTPTALFPPSPPPSPLPPPPPLPPHTRLENLKAHTTPPAPTHTAPTPPKLFHPPHPPTPQLPASTPYTCSQLHPHRPARLQLDPAHVCAAGSQAVEGWGRGVGWGAVWAGAAGVGRCGRGSVAGSCALQAALAAAIK